MGSTEQRREPRQAFRRWVEVLVLGTEPGQPPVYLRCGACDLSTRGARICTPTMLTTGSSMLVMFPLGQNGQNIVRFATIKSARAGASGWAECGVEFCAMPKGLTGQIALKMFDAARQGITECPPDSIFRAA